MRLSPPLPAPPGIAAAVTWLPDGRDDATAALAAGRLDDETASRLGYTALASADALSPPEMAAAAARKALAEAGWDGRDLSLVVHAWTYEQGNDFWSPAHRVAGGAGAHRAVAIGVQQMCNGSVAALEVAAARMVAEPAVDRCLVTTGDRFEAPRFDRWRGDYDVAYGDGATALLLSREDGPHRLLSVASVGVPEFEAMHRGLPGADATGDAAGDGGDGGDGTAGGGTIDVRRRKRAFAATGRMPEFKAALRDAVARVVAAALTDAGLTADDPRIRCLALPRIGVSTRAEFYDPALAALGLGHAEMLDFGRSTGHLGAGDAVANLAELSASDRLDPGEVALLLSVGAGFTWSCVVVQRA